MIMTTRGCVGPRIRNVALSSLPSSLAAETREMADVLEQYSSLSPSSDSSDTNTVLIKIVSGNQANPHPGSSPHPQHPPTAHPEVFDSETRLSLIELLLKDINACAQNPKSNKLKIPLKGSVSSFRPCCYLMSNPANRCGPGCACSQDARS